MRKSNWFIEAAQAAAVILMSSLVLTACGQNEPAATSEPAPPQLAPSANEAGGAVDADAVVVEVDGKTFTHGEMMSRVQQILRAQGGQVPPGMADQFAAAMSQRVIDGFIAQTVLAKEAERKEISVSPEEVEAQVQKLGDQLPPEVTLDTALEQMGITRPQLIEDITTGLAVEKLVDQQMTGTAPVSDEQVEAFYKASPDQFEQPETVSARHILLSVEPGAADEAKAEKRQQAEALRQQLVDGADFAELAREHSEGPSAPRGGDLGAFPRGQMVPAFEEAAFAQEVDAIGDVVETRFGYHIIQVQEHNQARTVPLEEVSEKIAGYLKSQEEQKVVEAYVQTLREKANITYGPAAP